MEEKRKKKKKKEKEKEKKKSLRADYQRITIGHYYPRRSAR